MDAGLRGQRVLITAGAAGIGLATARAFVREGARVHVCDVDQAALAQLRTTLPEVSQSVCDVADPGAVERLFHDATRALGGLDTLVNNAGIAGPTALCENVSLDDWKRTLEVNLTGAFLCTQRAIPLLKQSANASITNLSSVAGRFGYARRSPYSATKWGIVGFTKSLSIELGPFGIRVNAIQPGAVAGERIDRVIAAKAKEANVTFEEMRERYVSSASLRRFVEADDIANAIVFLSSPLGKNISGHALPIDGDMQSLA